MLKLDHSPTGDAQLLSYIHIATHSIFYVEENKLKLHVVTMPLIPMTHKSIIHV